MSSCQPVTGRNPAGTGLVIFDFDGVLVDSEVISLATLGETLREIGLDLTEDSLRERFLGGSMRQILSCLEAVERPAFPVAEFEARWYATLFDRFRSDLRAMPGAMALLDELERRGCAFCIASGSSMQRLSFALEVTGLAARFGGRVYSAEMVARGKPAPDLFEHAAREMGFARDLCLVIEDSPAGARAAHAAGMRALGFVGGSHLKGREGAHRDLLVSLHAQAVLDDLGAVRDWL